MDIRQSTSEDADQIFQLLCTSALWLKKICPQQWPMDWLMSKKQDITQSICDGQFYIVEINDEFAGTFEIKNEPESVWQFDDSVAYYVHKIAIDRTFKSLGLGPKILRHIFEQAKNKQIPIVRLDCVKANPFLKQFYLDQGFELKGSADDEGEEVLLFEYVV